MMGPKWADEPFALISTKAFSKNVFIYRPHVQHLTYHSQSAHEAYYVASQMAYAHNGIIRGLNSIYQQATHLPHDDHSTARDFLTYCQCWSESMHHHHDCEEDLFFPAIERLAGQPGLMAANVEHRAFSDGFDEFSTYAHRCAPADYDGRKLVQLIDGFAEPLIKHLHDEVETLRALDRYESAAVREAYQRLEKALMATDNFRVAPLVFGTADRTFEGGCDFPPVSFFVPSLVHYLFGWRLRGAWRFNPSSTWRDPKPLVYGE